MLVLTTLDRPTTTIWYLAYGSNLSAQKFIHDRKIQPLKAICVAVPGYVLDMNSAGVPYSEPAFASISPVGNTMQEKLAQLIGTSYLLTPDMYAKVIASEGGGIAYKEIEVTAETLPDMVTPTSGPEVQSEVTTSPMTVRTLVTLLPRRARPSARYMDLLCTGAKEAAMPYSYQNFLANIPTYNAPTRGRRHVGAVIFLAIWVPIMSLMEKITKASLVGRKDGQAPLWVLVLVREVVVCMWWCHDSIFVPVWGRGDGLDDDEG